MEKARTGRFRVSAVLVILAGIAACTNQPTTTSVGKSVATLVESTGINLNTNCSTLSPPSPDIMGWWNGMPPANRQYPFAGWELWNNSSACAQARLDAYRGLVTFNMASVSSLKGLVQKASLVVSTRALPPAVQNGGVITVGPFGNPTSVTLMCPTLLGGGGALQRFGPNVGTLPAVSGAGSLDMLTGTGPFPTGQVVYTFPATLSSSGPVPGATDPTTVSPSGNGGSVFTTDVTGAVTAALNAGSPGMSWMLTANFEGPLPGNVPTPGIFDCRTSYDLDLQITHF